MQWGGLLCYNSADKLALFLCGKKGYLIINCPFWSREFTREQGSLTDSQQKKDNTNTTN